MHIENPDALKAWLNTMLSPICDADPVSLARYVLALLKKDKPEKELKEFCVEQLDVFLSRETRPFIDKVFDAVKHGKYLPGYVAPPPKPAETEVKSEKDTKTSSKSSRADDDKSKTTTAQTPSESSTRRHGKERTRTETKKTEESTSRSAESKPVATGASRRRISPPIKQEEGSTSRKRSRSRSKERTTAAATVAQPNVRSRLGPPSAAAQQQPPATASAERDRSSRRAHEETRRDKDTQQSNRRQVLPPSSTSVRRSRSRSPDRQRSGRKADDATSSRRIVASTAANGSTKVKRYSSSDDSDDGASTESNEHHTVKRARKERCRDYEEKGFCMLGDKCEFDHGPDPVVVSDRTMLAHGDAPPGTVPAMPNLSMPPPVFQSPTGPPLPPGIDTTPTYVPSPIGGQQSAPYDPSRQIDYSQRPPPQQQAYMIQPPPGVNVIWPAHSMSQPPPQYAQQQNMAQIQPNIYVGQPPTIAYYPTPINAPPPANIPASLVGRLAPRFPAPGGQQRQHNPDNKTLFIFKIPPHENTISTLDSHFKQFGQITNIKVCHAGMADQALITYADRVSAIQALKSTQPILNNRFIRVLWYDESNDAAAVNTNTQTGAQQQQQQMDSSIRLTARGSLSKTLYNPAALRSTTYRAPAPTVAAVETAKAAQEHYVAERKARKDDKQRRQLTLELHKRKTELLDAAIKEQRGVLDKLEHAKSAEAKKELMSLFKLLDTRVKTYRGEVEALHDTLKLMSVAETKSKTTESDDVKAARTFAVPRKTSLSDSELSDSGGATMAAVKDGASTPTEAQTLHAKMAALKKELIMLNKLGGGGTPVSAISEGINAGESMMQRGRGSYYMGRGRGRGRGGARGGHRVPPSIVQLDKRPTNVLVTGFTKDEKDDLLAHLQQFGDVTDIEFDTRENEPRAHVIYKNRKSAEQAVELASDFKERTIVVTWDSNIAKHSASNDSTAEPASIIPDGRRAPSQRVSATDLLATLDDEEELSDGVLSEHDGSDDDCADDDDYVLEGDDAFDQQQKQMKIVASGAGSEQQRRVVTVDKTKKTK